MRIHVLLPNLVKKCTGYVTETHKAVTISQNGGVFILALCVSVTIPG